MPPPSKQPARVGYLARLLLLAHTLSTSVALQQQSASSLTSTRWKLRLDVGLQPGSWMPKRFPGWAESGARLGLDVEVQFTNRPSATREVLVGPKDSTFELQVCSPTSTFVSERGQETVNFTDGGWCIQRPNNSVKNAQGSLVKPEGLLRFWLDCPTGAKRQDVEIRQNTRIFFTTGVWDDPEVVMAQDAEYQAVLKQLQELVDQARSDKAKERSNFFEELQTFRKMVGDSKEFDLLKSRKEDLECALPPVGSAVSPNGVQIAPSGSLVIKGNSIPDWLPGSEYLILGTFSTSATD
eukprot:CAMPEP_0183301350 /NCGR_PEP_ID=MMETSP0160_2-20130417/7498_1 /TAXON_ID=2839 ORGANISM="Odontella Sinensis, Strain Grunow 1884" /NCGR_SAMPLE_ID=MMETSP0160_2 /ASSEMBLY_ACC=CAM_ASM_000250 /LENGTH=295 /DNA_ID=CAMNT_0025463949 /DNA_START=19 /DNA_END=906 /DNA_ORIENTATION=-